jgi:hypothetical protein
MGGSAFLVKLRGCGVVLADGARLCWGYPPFML